MNNEDKIILKYDWKIKLKHKHGQEDFNKCTRPPHDSEYEYDDWYDEPDTEYFLWRATWNAISL